MNDASLVRRSGNPPVVDGRGASRRDISSPRIDAARSGLMVADNFIPLLEPAATTTMSSQPSSFQPELTGAVIGGGGAVVVVRVVGVALVMGIANGVCTGVVFGVMPCAGISLGDGPWTAAAPSDTTPTTADESFQCLRNEAHSHASQPANQGKTYRLGQRAYRPAAPRRSTTFLGSGGSSRRCCTTNTTSSHR